MRPSCVRPVNERPLMSLRESIEERGESVNELAESKEHRAGSKEHRAKSQEHGVRNNKRNDVDSATTAEGSQKRSFCRVYGHSREPA
jgi:hypothetical protein